MRFQIPEEDRPRLTVVVAATDSPRAVGRTLESLRSQAGGWIEVIVVGSAATLPAPVLLAGKSSGQDPLSGSLSFRKRVGVRVTALSMVCKTGSDDGQSTGDAPHPGPLPEREGARKIRRIEAPPGSGVPRLRRLGLEAARGRIVAFTEDSCEVGPGWTEAWLSAFDDASLVAASGEVEHSTAASMLDWAVVFCEYAPFLPPSPPGLPARLAGNNFACLRELALKASTAEVHESALLDEVRRRGGHFRTVEAAMVRHVRAFGVGEAFGDRVRFGFEFGRLRASGFSRLAKAAGLIVGPAIFAIQAARLFRIIGRNRRHLTRFLGALPITLALLASWSLGEWAGWCLAISDRTGKTPS